ncbi:MAG: hypothetical protein QOG87_1563 [Actinomycetota bacterium]
MIVEFVGLPGSGKSTLARELASATGVDVVRAPRRRDLLLGNAVFLARSPLRWLGLLGMVLRHAGGPRLLRLKLISTFLDTNARYVFAGREPVGILDQGHVHNVVSLFESRVSAEQVRKYLRRIPMPDVILVVDSDPDERERRFRERGYGLREQFSEAYQEEFAQVVEANFAVLRDMVINLPTTVHIVVNDAPPAQVAARLAPLIGSPAFR